MCVCVCVCVCVRVLCVCHSLSLSLQAGQYEWLVHLSALALNWLRLYHDILLQVEEEISSPPNEDSNSASPDVTECELTLFHLGVYVCVCVCVCVWCVCDCVCEYVCVCV